MRGYESFSLLLSPLSRATFPSYDLCFPALPVKKGETSRGGGPTTQAVCCEVGVGQEVRMALGKHLLGAWPLADAEITSMAPGRGRPLPSVEPGELQGHLQVGQR